MTAHSPSDGLAHDLRVLRKQRGMTLAEVAGRLDRSIGWLSQVERNLSDPTTSELRALAKVLDVPFSMLDRPSPIAAEEADHVVRRNARRPVDHNIPGLTEALLSPDLTDDFEVLHSTFAPGAARKTYVQRPTQEVGYVVSGTLDLTLEDRTFTVGTGDSFRIRGEPFRWANPSNSEPCVVIWVIAPPVY